MKKLLVLVVASLFVVGCGSSKKKETVETTPDGSVGVESSALNFDAVGSDGGKIAGLFTVYFDYDKSQLSTAEQEKLAANAKWLKDNSSVKMLIEGHCDQRGSNEYNLSLGERRANSIKQALVALGVSSDRLSTQSFGEEKLFSTSDSEADMAKNRRANFVPTK